MSFDLKLHPSVRETIMEPERKFQVNTSRLFSVTLGFIPSFVNYHKRVYDQHELDCKRLEPARVTTTKKKSAAPPKDTKKKEAERQKSSSLDSIEIARAAVASKSSTENHQVQGSQEDNTPIVTPTATTSDRELSSTTSLPDVIDISESSTARGWTDYDTDTDTSAVSSGWYGYSPSTYWSGFSTWKDTDLDTSGVSSGYGYSSSVYRGGYSTSCTDLGFSESDLASDGSISSSRSGSSDEEDSNAGVWKSESTEDVDWMEEFSHAILRATGVMGAAAFVLATGAEAPTHGSKKRGKRGSTTVTGPGWYVKSKGGAVDPVVEEDDTAIAQSERSG